MAMYVFYMVENIVRGGESACYQDFLLSLQCFQKVSSTGSFKHGEGLIRVLKVKVKHLPDK